MPRPRRAQGRPGTPVIPAGWSDSHRPVTDKTYGAKITIRRPDPGTGEFNRTTGARAGAPYEPHFTGNARITVLTGAAQERLVAGMEVSTVAYKVSVGSDAAVRPPGDDPLVGCLVNVVDVDDNGIRNLVGRDLTVKSLGGGSLLWEQVLLCTDKLDEGT